MKITEKDIAELERKNIILNAIIEKQNATIDYLSMMTDVPLPNEDNNNE